MPRLDHRVPVEQRLSATEWALLRLVQDLINAVRLDVGMAPLTEQATLQQLGQLLRPTAAQGRAEGGA